MPESALYYKIVRNLPKEYNNYKDQLNTREGELTVARLSSFLTRASIAVGLREHNHQEERREEEKQHNAALITKVKSKPKKNELCNNYLRKGTCKFADNCRYLHLSTSDLRRFMKHANKVEEEQAKENVHKVNLITDKTHDSGSDEDVFADTPGLVL
jgi:hypothetical protein